MQLLLEITRTPQGRYEGHLEVPGITGQQDFSGILELLALLEEQLDLGEQQDTPPAERGDRARRDAIDDGRPAL